MKQDLYIYIYVNNHFIKNKNNAKQEFKRGK